MRRWQQWLGGAAVIVAAGVVVAATNPVVKPEDPDVIQVKKQPTETPQPLERAPETPTDTSAAQQAPAVTPSAPSQAPAAPVQNQGPAANQLSAGNLSAQPASDLGQALNTNSTGVEIQRRNSVVADPRVRGYHFGQLVTYGDGGYFFPARLDLDTAISKFDTESIRDLTVIKGPYSTRYGPGFAFLDIVTFDSPRATGCCDWELHGRTTLTYQTNGERFAGLQAIEYGARDFGFRVTYNLLVGNDYRAPGYTGNPDGSDHVPSSYNSQNFNFAGGFDLTKNTSIEFKALRIRQQNLEFPGLYFDIRDLNSEAYSVRFSAKENPYFDLFTFDVWYNDTVVNGDTQQGYKQAFLSKFLPGPNGFGLTPTPQPIPGVPSFFQPAQGGFPAGFLPLFTDSSHTHIAESSDGFRSIATWGRKDCFNFSVGVDFNHVNNGLVENIQIFDPSGSVPTTPNFMPGFPQTLNQNLGIPTSNSYDTGLFIEANAPVSDQLSFHTGARMDYVHTSTHQRLITGNVDLFGGAPAPGQVIDRANVDPVIFSVAPNDNRTSRDMGLGAAFLSSEYKFDDCLTGLMGFGYSMRPPTLTELYAVGPFVGVLQPGFNRLIGDPRLDPEKLFQYDVGMRADYGWFKGSVNAFYAWINDYITYDRNKSGEGITQVIFTNTDRATLAGGEIYGQVEATRWLTPFASATYVEGRDETHQDNRRDPSLTSSRRNGPLTEPLPGIPPLEIRSGVRVHEAVDNNVAPKWSVECSARCVFDQGLYAASLDEQRTGGFTVVDIRAYWQVNKTMLLTTGVENVGDRLYREHLDPRAGDLLYRPGINYYIATQFKY
jgi:outer membrane receptor protein involved in Fe transport